MSNDLLRAATIGYIALRSRRSFALFPDASREVGVIYILVAFGLVYHWHLSAHFIFLAIVLYFRTVRK